VELHALHANRGGQGRGSGWGGGAVRATVGNFVVEASNDNIVGGRGGMEISLSSHRLSRWRRVA
jgi:hypothetical protein